jgi:hypothetical protein
VTMTAARSSTGNQSHTVGWTVATVQYAYGALYALCGYFALAHAADLTGRWSAPTVETDTSWGWSYLVGEILSMAPMLAALGLLFSALLFLVGHTRGNRALTAALLGAVATTLLTLVVSLTPAAQSLSGWLLD